ncbi:alpha-protein kinase 1 isoform X2 [Nothobranchius furzeri]|uniref:alpha-protein kinase 1 isoform X2 n=1 Tax=Nothobranchius furzeri TaxID=105023 RepID=UPI002403F47F|nr:alpha-protein kinase 1 isoform X2 [Nothobranchius furzeri]
MEVEDLLQECLKAAEASRLNPVVSAAMRMDYSSSRDLLCAELAFLLQEAVEMKWPFVPEKWQYKKSVSFNDKTNLSDLISKHLTQLLVLLKTSIMAQEGPSAMAVVFLVDRFIYWRDESSQLLKIAKLLHHQHPDTPIAPQLVIRQARVYVNSGRLQKAEYILSSLINNSGTTGCWVYHTDSDRVLIQAVSVQVRGVILQKLGLWLQAAELIWASLVGFYSLPQPDKKGIGTSLGLLANIMVSMNDGDFHTFRTNPVIDMKSLLGNTSHRLLSAAHAAKMAVVCGQYTPLYVLTNATSQGTCLLSYCFSLECPPSQRSSLLKQAREAFATGLLTKAEGDVVTSQQELHTFLKAAYSITVTHKWLGAPVEVVATASRACQKALTHFYDYCHAGPPEKELLCTKIMRLVGQVKRLLCVDPFPESDKGSFIPDSYRNVKDSSVDFTLEVFSKLMQRFKKHHESLCRATARGCKQTEDETNGAELCLTALGTTLETLHTESEAEVDEPQQRSSDSSYEHTPPGWDLCPTLESSDPLSSSWQRLSVSSSGSPRSGSCSSGHGIKMCNQRCVTTDCDDGRSESVLGPNDKKQTEQRHDSGVGSNVGPCHATSSSSSSGDFEKFEMVQAETEILDTEEEWQAGVGVMQKPSGAEGAVHSLSQIALQTSSSSLAGSFSSQSLLGKIAADGNAPMCTKSLPSHQNKPGWGRISESLDSDGSFFIMETDDSEDSPSDLNCTKNQRRVGALSEPQHQKEHNICPNFEIEPIKPAADNSSARSNPELRAVTETRTDDSFEVLELSPDGHQLTAVTSAETSARPQRKSPLCYTCLNPSRSAPVPPDEQFLLSQRDYRALLAGVCHQCLLKRLHSDEAKVKLNREKTAHNALHLKFSKATDLWTAKETCVYIGKSMNMKGSQREAIWVNFLHQEERLSSYVGKDYLKPRGIQVYLMDVERQMTAQHYVTEFNKSLYEKDVMAQIFFIPSEALLILNGDEIVGCLTVEPYMLGNFVKLTNNTRKKDKTFQATEYGLAFGHFTYLFSGGQEVVVDLQGWWKFLEIRSASKAVSAERVSGLLMCLKLVGPPQNTHDCSKGTSQVASGRRFHV